MARTKSLPTLLRELRKATARRARRRGHLLGRFKPAPEGSRQHGVLWHAHCDGCWRGVVIRPQDGVAVGPALRERCTPKTVAG